MVKPKALTLESVDHVVIHSQVWHVPKCKAVIALVHGLGEHCGRYYELAGFFNDRCISVMAMDLRGHGVSGGKRGHTPGYMQWMQDIRTFMDAVNKKYKKIPVFLYGHSLGGSLVLNYDLFQKPELTGIIATSPALKLSFSPPKWKILASELLNILWPGLTFKNGLKAEHLSHDPTIVMAYPDDSLVHDRITVRAFNCLIKAGQRALDQAKNLHNDCYMLHGTHDQITDPAASREFCLRAGARCSYQPVEEGFHELHNDTRKFDVLNSIAAWIEHHIT